MTTDIHHILSEHNLKNTHARRIVLQALSSASVPLQQKDILAWAKQHGETINLVSIYRILEQFVETDIIHRTASGGYTLCTKPKDGHHHVLLSCSDCGSVTECADSKICEQEKRIAEHEGFTPKHHVSEIIGLCSSCT